MICLGIILIGLIGQIVLKMRGQMIYDKDLAYKSERL